MKRNLMILTLFLGLTVPSAFGATVYLKDGSQVRGTIVSATARDLQVHTPDGILNIASERILRVDYSDSKPVSSDELTPPATPPAPRTTGTNIYQNEASNSPMQMFGLGFISPISRLDFAPVGESADNGDAGFLLTSNYIYGLSPKFGVGVNVEYFNRSENSSRNVIPFTNSNISGNTLLLLATAKYSVVDHGVARPYVLGGLGFNRTSMLIDTTPEGGDWSDTLTSETRTVSDDSRWGLAYSGRLGVDFVLDDPSMFTLELGWTRMDNSDYSTTRQGKDLGIENVDGKLDVLSLAMRWGWRF
jgi:opacity protein-like surface antigen